MSLEVSSINSNERKYFKAAKYFDITTNNWKLDKIVQSVLEASKLCKTINDLDS